MKNVSVEYFDSLVEKRKEANVQPKYKIVSRQLDEAKEPILVIHTSGEEDFWSISIRSAAHNEDLLFGLCDKEKMLVKWLYENDCAIENYNYVD